MNEHKETIRDMLVDFNPNSETEINRIDQICKAILAVINNDSQEDGSRMIEAIVSLTHLIADPNLLTIKQRLRVLELIQANLDIHKVMEPERFVT
jgi:hypothetical protein